MKGMSRTLFVAFVKNTKSLNQTVSSTRELVSSKCWICGNLTFAVAMFFILRFVYLTFLSELTRVNLFKSRDYNSGQQHISKWYNKKWRNNYINTKSAWPPDLRCDRDHITLFHCIRRRQDHQQGCACFLGPSPLLNTMHLHWRLHCARAWCFK